MDQAKRLTADRRFGDTIHSFHDAWLDLGALQGADKNPMAFPVWNEALKTAMAEETRRYIEFVMKEGDGKLETLLSGKFTFLSGAAVRHLRRAGARWRRGRRLEQGRPARGAAGRSAHPAGADGGAGA